MDIKDKIYNEFQFFGVERNYLLAMSGGIDSSVLFNLMLDLNLNFGVAHAQFGLRGEESEKDEAFVRELCAENEIPYFTEKFNVPEHMESEGISLQMSARELRYEWFERLLEHEQFNYLVTAHHLNDSIETFFINLTRGTGLRGLTGIDHNEKVIRPMRGVSLKEIENYADDNQINWREDATNAEDHYLRNRIRHHIVPALEELDVNFNQSFSNSLEHLKQDVELISDYIDELRNRLFIREQNHIKIEVSSLKEKKNAKAIFYLFEPFGFKHPKAVEKLLNSQESAEIRSENYRLIKNRSHLLLQEKSEKSLEKYVFHKINDIEKPIRLRFKKKLTLPEDFSSHLDFEKIKFPISLRIRENGDKFRPSGMGGQSKKVSKFFKDLKLSKIEKENTWILCDADDKIIGIPGLRWDESFIADKETNIWLQVEKLD
ncbi:tRNA lysidine(34) synthetase TilS [Weeksellaceae bacterium KMM 9724]|uniref:tRNA lysidine(34) synthetase TilS n=1 Tax=Profundicola chukchiensis TaxID=2961959 RepID=UPI00243D58CB|nr:tRNA lysidine(34) synthetase TilS [Profundicola chukchiensis]MDG4949295.1 tRNA lysidine(34) synthetase TilS [Profundicola chukchiensis]